MSRRPLSDGERAVFAAAFDREFTTAVASMRPGDEHPAIRATHQAAGRVRMLRAAERLGRLSPDGHRTLDDDELAMLDDMLGTPERPPATHVPNVGRTESR